MAQNYYNYFIPYHPFSRVSSEIRYLPVTNHLACRQLKQGDVIFLYGHDIQGKISRIGKCVARSPITKYSDVPKNEKKYCTDTYCWQIPVKIVEGVGCGFDCRLMQYSGFRMDDIPFKPRKISRFYWFDNFFSNEEIYRRYWYIWKFCYDENVRNQYRRLVVHLYRDDMVSYYRDYKRFMRNKPLKCEKCGFELKQQTLGTNRFFEIHDSETDIMKPFRRLDYSKLQVLCPSCHALAHNEMIPVDVTDNERWMHGTDILYGGFSAWTKYLVEEFQDRFGKKKEEDPGSEFTPTEIYSMFSNLSDKCYPLSSDERYFAVWDAKRTHVRNIDEGDGFYHIIDRHLNSVMGPLNEVAVCKDKFVIVRSNVNPKYIIYKPDCTTIIRDGENEDFYDLRCDDDGRLYYGKTVVRPGHENDCLLSRYTTRYGCETIDRVTIIPFEYHSISVVDEKGFVLAAKGNKYGCIDLNNNIIIPFEYLSFYRYFGSGSIDSTAIVVLNTKKRTCCYLNRKNEIVGTFLADDLCEKRFHIYEHGGLYGVARQFGEKYTEAVYVKVNILNDKEIEVTDECGNVEVLKYE